MTVDLPDGRSLDLEVSGPEGGIPLLIHHGTPGSVTQFRAIARATHQRGLRLVTFSRSGYGDSTQQPGRRVVDVAADVAAVLSHLGAQWLAAHVPRATPHLQQGEGHLSITVGAINQMLDELLTTL